MLLKVIGSLLALALLVYVALLAVLFVKQEALMFPAKPLPDNFQFEFELPFEERIIPVAGAALHGLHFQQAKPQGVIFFLHGNGGNLVDWTENIEWYRENNYDLFIIDYRGYGKSEGRINSQAQLMADVRAAWQTMQGFYTDLPIIIYGRSLGSALAAQLATEVDADKVVLVSSFTSMLAMAAQQYPFVPLSLVRYPLRTDHIIGKINIPLLLIHGDKDDFIPIEHSKTLQKLARNGTRLLTIEGADHNDIHRFPAYLNGLAAELPGKLSLQASRQVP